MDVLRNALLKSVGVVDQPLPIAGGFAPDVQIRLVDPICLHERCKTARDRKDIDAAVARVIWLGRGMQSGSAAASGEAGR